MKRVEKTMVMNQLIKKPIQRIYRLFKDMKLDIYARKNIRRVKKQNKKIR